jgi:hypothetical protein
MELPGASAVWRTEPLLPLEDAIASCIYQASGLRKAAVTAAESRGFTAVLVSLALAAVVILLGMFAVTAERAARTDTTAAHPHERLADRATARFD